MEIGPIAGIRIMPAIKPRPVDPELTAFFEIEPSARPDEDGYSGSGRKAAGAEESEDEESEEPQMPAGENSSSASPNELTGTLNFIV